MDDTPLLADPAHTLSLPALSVRPPWAQCLMGRWKPCENRTWTTRYRGWLLLHAGRTYDPAGREFALRLSVPGWALDDPAYGYLGVINLVGVHASTDCSGGCGAWGAAGQYHWVMRDPRPFPQPIPGRGLLALYRTQIPPEAFAAARLVLA